MNNDSNLKGNIYQIKHLSEKNIPGNESVKSLQLSKLIESGQVQNLNILLEKDSLSPQILNEAMITLLKIYSKENHNFYEILHILLLKGVSVNSPIVYQGNNISIKSEDKITLLMFGIINNDINLIKLVLNYNPNLEKADLLGRNAIIYSILFDNNDSSEIINLLINKKANINYSLQIKTTSIQYHSVLTLACCKNLIKIVKCLLDNNVETNFREQPEGDTCLHIAVKYGFTTLVGLLLSYPKINPEIKNNQGKRAFDLIKKDENEQNMKNMFKNFYKNMNLSNYMGLYSIKGNKNMVQQANQINQFNQILQMNKMILSPNGFLINDSPNNQFNNKIQNNNIQNYSNNNANDNNNSSDEEGEDEKEHNNIESLNQNNHMKNNNYKNYMNNKFDNKNIKYTNNKNINKQFKRNLMENSDTKKPNINSTNYNQQKISHISIDKINLLKNNLANKLLDKQRIKYNMQIPVEFIKNTKTNKPKNLDNFMKQNNAPLLNLDLTNSHLLELELKILELKEKLNEKNRIISENILQSKINELDNSINEVKKLKEKREKEKNDYLEKNNENINIIKDLTEEQKELLEKIPSDKICKSSNKDISYNEFLKLKFKPSDSDLIHIYKLLQMNLIDYMKYIDNIMYKKRPLIESIINKIKLIIAKNTPEYEVKIYGTYATGLCMPWSNLNLILVNKNKNKNIIIKDDNMTNNETTTEEKSMTSQSQIDNNSVLKDLDNENNYLIENKHEIDLLSKLYYIFQQINWINKLQITQFDKINTLCFNTSEECGKIEININFENENHSGLKVLELVKSFILEYPVLKPLFLALSTILKSASLNNPLKGGISSYGLILMIVSFIQSQSGNDNLSYKEYIIGKTFYEFLYHYGINFDFDKYAIFTYKVNDKNNKDDKENSFIIGQNEKEVIIVDPLNNKNNVAKSAYQSKNAKISFMISFLVTKEECECGCHYGKAFYENNIKLTEHNYLKRMFNSVKRYHETGN